MGGYYYILDEHNEGITFNYFVWVKLSISVWQVNVIETHYSDKE